MAISVGKNGHDVGLTQVAYDMELVGLPRQFELEHAVLYSMGIQ
jgi:hypothetical protein